MHEIGHVLGFVSGIDDDGWLEVLTKAEEEEKELKNDAFKFATPLDLFRYSDNDTTIGEIDLSTGGNPYFSIDGGATNLANFSSGEYTDRGGDGYQASHWQNSSGTGIMNPILRAGDRQGISDLDLIALDVIGWDLNDTSLSLDWQQMYDDAESATETATIEDRSKDVEKLIKESEYEGRKSRSSRRGSSNRSWQFGFWQYTTVEEVATDEIPEIVDSVEETELIENPEIESVEELENADLAEDIEIFESIEDTDSENGTILQPSDTFGLEVVSGDEQNQDPLLSGGLRVGM